MLLGWARDQVSLSGAPQISKGPTCGVQVTTVKAGTALLGTLAEQNLQLSVHSLS